MSVKSKVMELAAIALVGGTMAACGSSPAGSGQAGLDRANDRPTPDVGRAGSGQQSPVPVPIGSEWFEPAGVYEMAWEHQDRVERVEATVFVGDPYPISETPSLGPDISSGSCEQYGTVDDAAGPGATAFPVHWNFENTSEEVVSATIGVQLAYAYDDTLDPEPSYYLDFYHESEGYDDSGFFCQEQESEESLSYISPGEALGENGVLVYPDYGGGTYQQLRIVFGPYENTNTSDEWHLTGFTGPGTDFEGQKDEYGGYVAQWSDSGIVLLLPVGREPAEAEVDAGVFTNGY